VERLPKYTSIDSILENLDRSSPDKLLSTLAAEFLKLNRAYHLLAAKMAAMETLQTTIDRIAQIEAEAMYADDVAIFADQPIPGSWGFHKLEYEPSGTTFRWTGPEQAFSFQFFLNRKTPTRFSMQFGRIFSGASVDGIRCLVDGTEVPTKILTESDGYKIQGQLPARRDAGGSVLTFICPSMESPINCQKTTDDRLLGLSFRSLQIKPSTAGVSNGSAASTQNQKAIAMVKRPVREDGARALKLS
jgi:hypothetical protein